MTLAVVLLLTGCLQSQTTVTVAPDGSGTVERNFVMKHEIVEMLAGMSGTAPEDFTLYEDGELEAEAQSMGPDVTLESVEPIDSAFGRGYSAIFSFADINSLRVNQNPGDAVPSDSGGGETVELVTFSLTPGRPASLVISLPQSDSDGAGGQSNGESPSQEELESMTEFYRDMRIGFDVVAGQRIVDTNATHRDGNTITLMDIDFNTILQDPDATRRLIENQANSLAEVQELLSSTPGIKAELQEEVSIRFR